MPRGKYVNHKGRCRKFSTLEELQRQVAEKPKERESSENDNEGATTSSKAISKNDGKVVENKPEKSSSEEDDRDVNFRKGVASLIQINNPNRGVKKLANNLKTLSLGNEPEKKELSRREREEIERQKARIRYMKLHALGQTPEAKADLARLALVKQKREEAQAQRQAVLEQKKAAAAAAAATATKKKKKK